MTPLLLLLTLFRHICLSMITGSYWIPRQLQRGRRERPLAKPIIAEMLAESPGLRGNPCLEIINGG
jgi:hypothetical protein